jgi:hypothetical protein
MEDDYEVDCFSCEDLFIKEVVRSYCESPKVYGTVVEDTEEEVIPILCIPTSADVLEYSLDSEDYNAFEIRYSINDGEVVGNTIYTEPGDYLGNIFTRFVEDLVDESGRNIFESGSGEAAFFFAYGGFDEIIAGAADGSASLQRDVVEEVSCVVKFYTSTETDSDIVLRHFGGDVTLTACAYTYWEGM